MDQRIWMSDPIAKDPNRAVELVFILSEVVLIFMYLYLTKYGEGVHPAFEADENIDTVDFIQGYYPIFQDVHTMIFIGFGFLMVFLKTHSWTSVGFNFVIGTYALQLTIIVVGLWHMILVEGEVHKIALDIPALIIGDFGAGAVLITFGALLGKCSLFQLWMVATLEIIFYGLNETIGAGIFGAVDMGGSMYVHTFGAYFGLAATYFFQNKEAIVDKKDRSEGSYTSNLIAFVGTIYLWMFWPSFNGALAKSNQQQRVIVNTVLAISASCIGAVGLSRIIYRKIDIEVILNATLAGGVAVGSASDLVVTAGVAMLIGLCAGIVSAFGFMKISGFLRTQIRLHDTCGVHNLHGIPGIMGGLIGAISASLADTSFTAEETLFETFPRLRDGRTTGEQGYYQIAALGVTLLISIVGGAFTGFVTQWACPPETLFYDPENFKDCEPPSDGEEEHEGKQVEMTDRTPRVAAQNNVS